MILVHAVPPDFLGFARWLKRFHVYQDNMGSGYVGTAAA
jgi:hypothetical protein